MKNQVIKTGIMAGILMIALLSLAQAAETEVNRELDGFGLIGYKFSVMDEKPMGLLHTGMGVILWDRWYLGAEVSSTLPDMERRIDGTKRTITGGYAGLLVGVKILRSGPFLLGFQNTSGLGGFIYEDVNDLQVLFYYIDSTLFGEWDVANRTRIGVSLGNRVAYSVKDAPGLDADMFKGPFIGTYVRIGTY